MRVGEHRKLKEQLPSAHAQEHQKLEEQHNACQETTLPISGSPVHTKKSWLACMCAPEPRRATGDGWCAQRDGSACHFWHTCHRFSITELVASIGIWSLFIKFRTYLSSWIIEVQRTESVIVETEQNKSYFKLHFFRGIIKLLPTNNPAIQVTVPKATRLKDFSPICLERMRTAEKTITTNLEDLYTAKRVYCILQSQKEGCENSYRPLTSWI
ncbi:uncharacterized protein LOC113420785 [Notechis scutatus]|uniref:Uncharacterized protein LOC113420785 n=1 Tax=Notechis scutatus TaxID=8663 RepID=A0A6J1V1M3_9SAUR|nr:uncharacterized protein LOC113420785 [Notechis scutatus]